MAKQNSKLFDIQKGVPLPLGTHFIKSDTGNKTTGTVNFSVSFPNQKNCKLNIYNREDKKLIQNIQMDDRFRLGSIFSVAILDFDYSKYEYMYEINGVEQLDPYARVVTGRTEFGEVPSKDNPIRCAFYFDQYDWEEDRNPKIEYQDLILYRLHVRGYTKHISSKVKNKGTFLGLTGKIPYLKELGVNAVELLTVHEFPDLIDLSEKREADSRFIDYSKIGAEQKKEELYQINYWGYSNQGNYFAPKMSYSSDIQNPVDELKDLIKEFHKNGIEVILEFFFHAGTNQRFILDVLHYWVLEYHVDGFKLNTDVVMGNLIATDPVLSDTKLFGMEWNVDYIYGADKVPIYKNLAIYNDGYQNDMRRFLKGDEEQVSKVSRLIKRNPSKQGVINYITNTNGFTLMDLFSYDVKHNEANGENNQDGSDYNYSWNCGFEGKTKRKKIVQLRRKQIRNALTILIFSQGTPMILAGDEFGNSQDGNNNAYCQDNHIGWLNWSQLKYNNDIFEYLKYLIQIRKTHPVLHNREELKGIDYLSCGYPDLSFHGTRAWYPDYSNYSRVLGVFLSGRYVKGFKGEKNTVDTGKTKSDDSFYIAYNMHWEPHEFDLPKLPKGENWKLLIDTSEEVIKKTSVNLVNQKQYILKARSVLVLIGNKGLDTEEISFE